MFLSPISEKKKISGRFPKGIRPLQAFLAENREKLWQMFLTLGFLNAGSKLYSQYASRRHGESGMVGGGRELVGPLSPEPAPLFEQGRGSRSQRPDLRFVYHPSG